MDNRRCNNRRPLRSLATAAATLLVSSASAFSVPPVLRTEVRRRALAVAMAKEKNQQQQQQHALLETQSEFVSSSTVPTKTSGKSEQQPAVGTPLRMVVDEQKEFQMNLGKAVDALRHDYPCILTDDPDFSIYHDNLEVVDPTGVTLHGLTNYKMTFSLIHTIINFFYCPEKSGITFRLVYDWASNNVRVSWNAILVPKAIFGGVKTRLHVDGISVYVVEKPSGLVTQHRVEHLLINDAPVRPQVGIFQALKSEIIDPEGIPVLGMDGAPGGVMQFGEGMKMNLLEFKQNGLSGGSSLFDPSTSSTTLKAMVDDEEPTSMDSSYSEYDFDPEAYARRNQVRKKFGLKPLSPEEFEKISIEARELELQNVQKIAAASAAAELSRERPSMKKKNNFLKKMFGGVLEDTCESNWDCKRPQVCCDFKIKKVCCTSGARVVDGVDMTPRVIKVPVESDEFYGPDGGPYGGQGGSTGGGGGDMTGPYW